MGDLEKKVKSVIQSAATEARTAKAEWEQFGTNTAGSRWFNGVPKVALTESHRVVWKCPTTGCDGDMQDTGEMWMTGDPGYHHECNVCGFKAAIKGAVFNPRGDQ
ncbi:hypothetical protein [Undibacterium oligocarboniphilum]|uniref:Uncharacterized protein n=1 Tax=Undibacterium oligocarboniphilum TaxID=666702 RepID=A0A850QPY4_9BURK|nr:hypothetical protein [Undibacterium oligocarboniphilum]MBC3871757.1 hypothetical protein [Undibacterium oligocarboniphilum]NVO79393.1 hypothetical protein [Undibacterium oligocarboniphilum]